MQFAYEVLSKITQEKFFLKLVQVGIIIDNNEQQGDVGSRSTGIETILHSTATRLQPIEGISTRNSYDILQLLLMLPTS